MSEIYGFEFKYSFEELPNGLQKFSSAKDGNSFTIKYLAKGPEFDLVCSALEEATYINHITGSPFVRTSILYRQILMRAIIKIEFPDNEKMSEILIEKFDLNSMNYTLAKLICKHWLGDAL